MRLNRSWRRKLLAKRFFDCNHYNSWERWCPAGSLCTATDGFPTRLRDACVSQGTQFGSVEILQLAAVPVLEIALAQGIDNKSVKTKVLTRT